LGVNPWTTSKKKDLQKKTERKRDNKDKKQSEKTREMEESKGARVIRPFWFAVVGFILSMVALLSWFFSVSLVRFLKGTHRETICKESVTSCGNNHK
jgi:hypothetical protein